MSKFKRSASEKLDAIQTYEEGVSTLWEVARLFGVTQSTLLRWRQMYRQGGISALEKRSVCTKYSNEFKDRAVRDVLEKGEPVMDVIIKLNISSTSVLRRWISNYNGRSEGRLLKERSTMTKGRITTFEERVSIVKDCLKNGKKYKETAKTHRVSYQQIYKWVQKYEKNGIDGLMDGRGRMKPFEELTDVERLSIEMKKVEQENELLRMENEFLKKLEEFERGRD